jgi:hypothetical protein
MAYRCPVCGFTVDSDTFLARHMINTYTLHEHHIKWMESNGIDWSVYSPYQELEQQKALLESLRKVISVECQIAD